MSTERGAGVAARNDEQVPSDASASPNVPASYRSVANFLTALRRDDEHALRQLFVFYGPVLRDEARRMGLGPGDRREMVTTVLDDVVMRLQASSAVPADFIQYLVTALRNRVRTGLRQSRRSAARSEEAFSMAGSSGQRVVAECHSAYGLRASEPADAEDIQSLRLGIRKLAEFSAQALSTVDASLMVGLGRLMPLRELAAREGISYGAARVRVHRLRERFRKLAVQHLSTLEPAEREELEQFFRRAGVVLDSGNAAGVRRDKESGR
jgi:DNA-directed RNA polymerase specialized sigma24 family protein